MSKKTSDKCTRKDCKHCDYTRNKCKALSDTDFGERDCPFYKVKYKKDVQ